MANYRKSFNFRNGVQVDEDNFVVNSVGLVGIGTTVPTETLDVIGNVKISGSLTVNNLIGPSVSNDSGAFNRINVGITSINSGIITASTGIVTYYGDGSKLSNIPTSQWQNINAGLGFVSIYNSGYVGVGTNDPRFLLQVGGTNVVSTFNNGLGINDKGDVVTSGVITATRFSGNGSTLTNLNASNISSGSLVNSILPSSINVSGIVSAGNYFSGNLVGVANTANNITSSANITVNSINSSLSNCSISTVTNLLYAQQKVGIGTTNPSVDLHVRSNGSTAIQITSDGNNSSRFILGRNIVLSQNNSVIQHGNTNPTYLDSTINSLDIINNSVGNLNHYLHLGNSGVGTGNFNWIYGQSLSKLMTLTYQGNLGIGIENPINTLHVVGTSTVTGNSFIGGNLSISGSFTPSTITVLNNGIFNTRLGIQVASPSYTFQIGKDPLFVGGGIGINTLGDVYSAGVITATRFSGNGSTLTNLNPSNLVNGTIGGSMNVNTSGVVTATRFSGDGSTLTNLNPSNLVNGTIGGSMNVNTSGVVTATKFSGDGLSISSLNGSSINSGTIAGTTNLNTLGVATAFRFSGNGSTLTNLNPSNISSGTISGNISVNTSGIVTSTEGFISGVGTAVRISTVGNTIIFTVPGVGSATLVLV